MKWIEGRVTFAPADKSLAVELVSEIFSGLGVGGVVVEDPDEEPIEGWGEGPVFKPESHAVIGFFPGNASADAACRRLEKALAGLFETTGIATRVAYREIDEEDWAESWKAFFWPEKLSRSIVVKPTWRDYDARPGEIVLEIDPGMAFGTGTHPTTRLCINMIETHLKAGDGVLDIGTGSGILLAAAAGLGAGRLWGIDIDEVAVEISRNNLLLNGIGAEASTLLTGALVDVDATERFELIVANILSEVIVELLPEIPGRLKPGGLFICSGIIEKNAPGVRERMAAVGLHLVEERQMEDWVALAGKVP